MTRTRIALAVLAAMFVAGAAQAQPAAPKAAAPAAPAAAPAAAAPAGKALYPQAQFDFMLKERLAHYEITQLPATLYLYLKRKVLPLLTPSRLFS